MRNTLVALTAVALLAVGCSADTSDTDNDTETGQTTTSDQTTEEASGPSEQEVTAWARSQAGLPEDGGFQSTGGWMDYLVGARLDRSNLYITLQVDRSDKGTAERAKKFYVNTLQMTSNQPAWTEDVRFVIVEDGANVVITQESV